MIRSQPLVSVQISCARLSSILVFTLGACSVRAEAAPPRPVSPSKAKAPECDRVHSSAVSKIEISQLEQLILSQSQAIEELKARLSRQEALIAMIQSQRNESHLSPEASTVQLASLAVVQASSASPSPGAVTLGNNTTQTNAEVVSTKVVAKPEEKTPANALSINGFKFSGDFRFRADVQARSGNDVAGPLQNIRGRYRVRLNVDKDLERRFNFHMQLSTGPYNVATTNDEDFAGTTAKHPFSMAEAFIDFHPNSNIALRGGRMEEVFADNMRFLWDDDVRFNGFQQVLKLPMNSTNSLELRMGEYWLSNPNVVVLAATSPYVSAGYQPGQKVRDANLFHPGAVLNLSNGGAWKHRLIGDVQIYRNPNQIQLASTAPGFPVLVSNPLGLALSGPISASGNATTIQGGAIFTAPDFDIARASYRIEHKGVRIGEREMPLWFDFQVARNYGASFLRDSVMGSVNLGVVKKAGDLRFLYQYAIKDANSIISQFTDDDLGTGLGVNLAVHAIRVDIGLTRFLQWQNLLFVQNERRSSDPGNLFFVPLQRGANTTFRYLGQLAFSF